MKRQMLERFSEEKVKEFSLYPPAPKSLNIELNNTCNQHCVFCSFHSKLLKEPEKPSHMSVDLAKKILYKASEQGIGRKEIGFYSTGEALLHKGLEECIDYAKKLGCPYVFLTTNGVLATPERMRSLINAGLDSIRFSVNAYNADLYKEIHGTDDFEKVINNLHILAELKKKYNWKISTSISSVVTKKTINNMNDLHELFDGLVDEVVFLPVMDLELLGKYAIKRYAIGESRVSDDAQSRICAILFNSMYIGSHGRVRLCCDVRARDVVTGDTNDDFNLMKIWHNDIFVKYRKKHLENDIVNSVCKGCQMTKRAGEDYFLKENMEKI